MRDELRCSLVFNRSLVVHSDESASGAGSDEDYNHGNQTGFLRAPRSPVCAASPVGKKGGIIALGADLNTKQIRQAARILKTGKGSDSYFLLDGNHLVQSSSNNDY